MTTAEAASKVPAAMIASTLAMYLALYVFLIVAYVAVLFQLARSARPPDAAAERGLAAAVISPITGV
jgi:cytochrome d ubiquinol oxidase subunit I